MLKNKSYESNFVIDVCNDSDDYVWTHPRGRPISGRRARKPLVYKTRARNFQALFPFQGAISQDLVKWVID